MHLAPACTFWLGLGMMVVEWPSMRANNALQLMATRPLLYLTGGKLRGHPLLTCGRAWARCLDVECGTQRAAGLAAAGKPGSNGAAWW